MARKPSEIPVNLVKADGTTTVVTMTARQKALFDLLFNSLDTYVTTEDILRELNISIENLRVTKQQVQRIVNGYYAIVCKRGHSYSMCRV